MVTRVLPGHHRDLVTLFPTGTDLILVTLVLTLASSLLGDSDSTWASPVPGVSGTHRGSISIWLHCSLTVTQLDLLTLVFTWATPGPGDSDVYLGIIETWFLCLACSLA